MKAKSNVVPINNTPVETTQQLHSLVLYSLYAPTWTAYKKDKVVTKQVKEMNNVDEETDAGSYNKLLLPECDTLKKLKSYIGSVRQGWFYGRTQPWGENRGDRVGNAEDVPVTLQEFGDKQEGLKPFLKAFEAEYESMKALAEFKLNEMYNPNDYPPLDRVMEKFKLRLSVRPLPNIKDVRVMTEIPPHIRADIEEALKTDFNNAYTATAKLAFERLLKPVQHMAKTLRAYDKGEVKKLFDSVVENVRNMADMAHTLNITKDAQIEKLADEMFTLVQDLTADSLKESEGQLRTKAKAAEDLAARIAKFMPK